jgi:hypothetical protein
MRIFDRWGVMVYKSDDFNQPWNGYVENGHGSEPTKEDVYVWKAEVIDIFNKTHILTGHVTVLR